MNFIFLTYVNRSGSTYLANLLDSSPEILACPEGDILVSYFLEDPGREFEFDDQKRSRLIKFFSSDPKLQCWGEMKLFFPGLEKAQNNLEAFITILINYKNQVKPYAENILFKAERIVFLVRKIRKVRIDHTIRYISIIRDPRAVFASQKKTIFPEILKIMSNDPIRTAIYWKKHIGTSYSLKGKNFLIIKFEDLIMNFSPSINILSDFFKFNLSELSPEKGNLIKRMANDQIKIHENIQKMPVIQKIDEWQKELTSTEIYIIERISHKYLTESGYIKIKPDNPGINIFLNMKCKLLKLNIIRLFKKISFHISRMLTGS